MPVYNPKVALLTESVDRNTTLQKDYTRFEKSLSSRRAWIEMLYARLISSSAPVALLTESVDRNDTEITGSGHSGCRSPHGERG